MKKFLFIITALVGFCFVSCKESDDDDNDFGNWQQRNEDYFESVYSKAASAANSGNKSWKIFNKWSKNDDVVKNHQEQIVVEVLNEGTGKESPLYTDSVRIHYEGRLMPNVSYPQGYVFDCSWNGTYNIHTMVPYKSVASAFIDGFTTALLHMHVGDRWRVYIPQTLGYGSSYQGSIPSYSTLVFDLTLQSFGRPGTPMPSFQ